MRLRDRGVEKQSNLKCPIVSQFQQELVTYGGNGQVFSNSVQVEDKEVQKVPEKKGRLATPYTKKRSGFLSFFSTLAPMRLAKETRTAFFIAIAM